jgi:hypothetical protein
MKSQFLKEWEAATENLKEAFIVRYFMNASCDDYYWVADQIGGVLSVNDYFFNLDSIVDYIRYKYTPEEMFEHYDYALKCHENGETSINIKNYKLLRKKSDLCNGEKRITNNPGLDNEFDEACPECVGVDDTDFSGACGTNDR